jgi:hypothetical protein
MKSTRVWGKTFPPEASRRASAYRRRQNLYAKAVHRLQRALNVHRMIHNWVRLHWGLGKNNTPAMAMGYLERLSPCWNSYHLEAFNTSPFLGEQCLHLTPQSAGELTRRDRISLTNFFVCFNLLSSETFKFQCSAQPQASTSLSYRGAGYWNRACR